MNGYDLTRAWYNYKFANPDKVRHVHSDMYFYLIDKWNRLGQTPKFGLPTDVTMQALCIGSYNTYKKCLEDLIDFGFVILVQDAKNQYHSKIIALSKIDKATDEPLDKATAKATDEPTDTINKQRTKNKEQENNDYSSVIKDVVDYLNQKMERDFKHDAEKNRKHIIARLKEGYSVEELKSVVDIKYNTWFGNPSMEIYLRPETLFGSKMDSYLNEVPTQKKSTVEPEKVNSSW